MKDGDHRTKDRALQGQCHTHCLVRRAPYSLKGFRILWVGPLENWSSLPSIARAALIFSKKGEISSRKFGRLMGKRELKSENGSLLVSESGRFGNIMPRSHVSVESWTIYSTFPVSRVVPEWIL